MERRGDGARAMGYHRAALDIDPRFLPSALQTARLLRGSGSPDGALAVLVGIRGTGSPAARLALGESVILLDSLGREPEADSLAMVLDGSDPGVWLELADQYLDDHPSRVRESLTRASESPGLETMRAGIARILADLGDFEGACTEARAALEAGGDTTLALSVLGRSLLELGRNSEAEETFRRLVELGSGTVDALNALGWLAELRARTTDAVEYYLDALALDPSDPFARERLLAMADDSYDPFAWSSSSGGFSANCSADLSVEHGNRERVNIGGSATLAWLIDGRGTSVDLGVGGRSVTWESDEGFGVEERQTDTGWASLSADCWLDEHLYLEAGTDWDRQRFTVRPWQVSSYLACGLRERIVPWLSLTPELGLGYVRTKWQTKILEQITGQTTVYASTGLWFEKPHTFVQHAEISGELYVPPDSPDDFISSGRISLAFRTWEPLSLSLGYEVDYTRIPEIATWKKYDTRFSVRLNFTLL